MKSAYISSRERFSRINVGRTTYLKGMQYLNIWTKYQYTFKKQVMKYTVLGSDIKKIKKSKVISFRTNKPDMFAHYTAI